MHPDAAELAPTGHDFAIGFLCFSIAAFPLSAHHGRAKRLENVHYWEFIACRVTSKWLCMYRYDGRGTGCVIVLDVCAIVFFSDTDEDHAEAPHEHDG